MISVLICDKVVNSFNSAHKINISSLITANDGEIICEDSQSFSELRNDCSLSFYLFPILQQKPLRIDFVKHRDFMQHFL